MWRGVSFSKANVVLFRADLLRHAAFGPILFKTFTATETVSSVPLHTPASQLRTPSLRLLHTSQQDRAEYRGYCERICGGDPFSVEDTLALQLERRGPQYAGLAGDAVVGLASLAVTLASRCRLAVNGTVESVGRLLAHSMAFERGDGGSGGGGGAGAGAGRTSKWRGSDKAVRNVVSS